jgi:hypothetical protein
VGRLNQCSAFMRRMDIVLRRPSRHQINLSDAFARDDQSK